MGPIAVFSGPDFGESAACLSACVVTVFSFFSLITVMKNIFWKNVFKFWLTVILIAESQK